MNGYEWTRMWYNYKFENPSIVSHVHSDLFFYILDLWNRLGQKNEFGLPTTITMEAVGIKSYNTYKRVLNDLISFGFITSITKSINQHQSRVIALSKNDKAEYEALDKALTKADDDIIEQETNNKKPPVSDIADQVHQVVNHLNAITGKNYQLRSKSTAAPIKARLKEGFVVEELKSVIESQHKKWANDSKMKVYLRPVTLFGSKFESYLQFVEHTKPVVSQQMNGLPPITTNAMR